LKKGFTFIELLIVISIIGILAVLAVPIYQGYTKRTRTIEVPWNLKAIVQEQHGFTYDPAYGRFVTAIESLAWKTSSGGSIGKFFKYSTSGVPTCDPGSFPNPVPEGLAEAVALSFSEVPDNYRGACMDSWLDIKTNSE
jgi:prepilin-type N-terminal cleavage/methylation domain-containing protein